MTTAPRGAPRLSAALRHDGRVAPLELFFDLVFVLALTQCTALMADVPTVEGVAQAMLVLSALWWSWVGYAWLTSVVDPDSSVVRLAVFVAMAAFLVAALCVPGAFGGAALTFALAYATVRVAHIGLFLLASRDDPALRSSVVGLAGSSAIGIALLLGAAAADDRTQALLWVAALVVDCGGPLLFGADGWTIVPEHFAERHGLIIIIALGESIVAIGAGVVPGVDAAIAGEVALVAVAATVLVVALWWLYFDTSALAAAHRLEASVAGRARNDLARDAFSYLHLPMVAGIVLVALGLKKTLGHVDDPLALVPAAALLGGTAVFLGAHVAFGVRTSQRLSLPRLACAVLLLALIPVATQVAALVAVGAVTALLVALAAYETLRLASARSVLRADGAAR